MNNQPMQPPYAFDQQNQEDDQPEFNFNDSIGGDEQNQSMNRSLNNQANPLFANYGQPNATNDQDDLQARERALLEQLNANDPNQLGADQGDLRFGGNNLNIEDPEKPPFSAFYLMVTGHVQSGTFDNRDGICCAYHIEGGKDWQTHSGNKSGVSQHAYKNQQSNRRVVWNYPFEVVYRGYNVSGWPILRLQFTSRDFLGRDIICGYGVTHLPTQPGSHTRYVHIFAPVSSSLLSSFFGFLLGKPAEYLNPTQLLTSNDGREVTRVESTGLVKVQFNVTIKGLDAMGVYPFKA